MTRPRGALRVRVRGEGPQSYSVMVGSGLLGAEGGPIARLARGRDAALIVADAGLPTQLVEAVESRIAGVGVRVARVGVRAQERRKSLATLELVLAAAAASRLDRGGLIVGLGGGVVTDLAGFAAAVYRRGVDSVLCPTTLLAMVDASVGGKTGVNIEVGAAGTGAGAPRLLKNMAGAFHHPRLVVCDVAALASLSLRQLRAGLAECLKHGLVGAGAADAGLWGFTQRAIDRLAHEPLHERTLAALVGRHAAYKARVVAADPKERARGGAVGRMALNLGHTFAHAIETLPGLRWPAPGGAGPAVRGPLLHGEAVGLGLIAAADLGESLRRAEPGLALAVEGALGRAGLPTRVGGLPASDQVIDRMLDDKKVLGGRLRVIVPTRARRAALIDGPDRGLVARAIDRLRA
ncbi:MAG: 3-dehydroquinate synthase [Planctomyces sp.]|nr:3-dehydroquinate synthase [Planctomyces sp.]